MKYETVRINSQTDQLDRGKLKVAILGATGMVGQQFIELLTNHPWFEIVVVAASQSSAGKSYAQAVEGRWAMQSAIPGDVAQMTVRDVNEVDRITSQVDVAFCALSLDKESVRKLEHEYASKGVWLTSNNSAFRGEPFVPMVIPAVNATHLDVIPEQRRVWGYDTGAIIVKSNCSIQSYVIALEPLRQFGIERILVHSEQAISGAGKTFNTFPKIERNLIPLIVDEERKSEVEPLKIWGKVGDDGISPAAGPKIKAKCVRVAVFHGHTAYVTVRFKNVPTFEQILERWEDFKYSPRTPSAPQKFLHYLSEPDRPQPLLDVMREGGMAVSLGQLKVDDGEVSFTALSHNLILGAAGGAVLATEAAIARGFVFRRVKVGEVAVA